LLVVAALMAGCLLVAACGGGNGGDEPRHEEGRYDNEELGFGFDYPANWPYLEALGSPALVLGEEPKTLAKVGLGEVDEEAGVLNGIVVDANANSLDTGTTQTEIDDILLDIDGVFAQLAARGGGALVERGWTELGGLRARRWVMDLTLDGILITSEQMLAVSPGLSFQLRCEAERTRFQEVRAGCQVVFDSFEFTSETEEAEPSPTAISPSPTGEQPTPTAADQGVPMFRGNPARTGVNPGPGVERSPKLLWRFQTGDAVSSSPAVVDGVVYVGSQDGYVYALEAAAGEERWHFQTGDAVTFSPAVVDGVVYIGSDGHVYALDAATGEQIWRFETGDSVTSSPAVVDGVVYVGGQDSYVYALDAATGEERWRFETGGGVDSSPAVVEGLVYVGSADSYVYALDAATGEERWRFETNGAGLSSPAVVEGLVYIGSDGGYDFLDPCGGGTPYLYALDSVTGEERWRFETGCRQVLPSPAVVDGVVYMGGGSDPCNPESPYVYALDAATGEERWRFEMVSDVSCSPAVVDAVVYICTASLYAITEE